MRIVNAQFDGSSQADPRGAQHQTVQPQPTVPRPPGLTPGCATRAPGTRCSQCGFCTASCRRHCVCTRRGAVPAPRGGAPTRVRASWGPQTVPRLPAALSLPCPLQSRPRRAVRLRLSQCGSQCSPVPRGVMAHGGLAPATRVPPAGTTLLTPSPSLPPLQGAQQVPAQTPGCPATAPGSSCTQTSARGAPCLARCAAPAPPPHCRPHAPPPVPPITPPVFLSSPRRPLWSATTRRAMLPRPSPAGRQMPSSEPPRRTCSP